MKRAITEDIDKKIRTLAAEGHTYASVARLLDLQKSTVRRHSIKNNIYFPNRQIKIQENADISNSIVELYSKGFSGHQIADKFEINKKTVYNVLNANGTLNPDRFNYSRRGGVLSETAFFDFNNDRLAAYFYGWLLTDGCLSDEGCVSISLKESDKYIVDEFIRYLGLSRKSLFSTTIANGKEYGNYSTSIKDKIIAGRLSKQGLEPRKSGKEKLPKFDYLFGKTAKDFWQGCVEGDGWISLKGASQIGLLGSDELLKGFIEFCEKVCRVKIGKIPMRLYNTDKIKQVKFYNDDAMKIAKVLWQDTVLRLERKYNLAKELIDAETERQKRYATKYVSFHNGIYEVSVLIKQINSEKAKPVYLGRCKTLPEAQDLRDEFMSLYEDMKLTNMP